MSEQTHNDIDIRTRRNLAYFWSVVAALMIFYIIVMWGDEKEILTLIIGLIGGTILGGVFSIYFGGTISKRPEPQVPVTGDNPQINVNTNEKNPPEQV